MPFHIFHKSKKSRPQAKSSLDLSEQKVTEPPDLDLVTDAQQLDEKCTSILKDCNAHVPTIFPSQCNQRRRVSIGPVSFFGNDNPSQSMSDIPKELSNVLKKSAHKKSKSTLHLNFLGKGHNHSHVSFESDYTKSDQSKSSNGKNDKKKRRSSIHSFMGIGHSLKKLGSKSGSLHKLNEDALNSGNDSGITHDADHRHDHHQDNHSQHHGHHHQHHSSKHHREHRKSFSCGANLDQMADTREQRISDIVQLDNYIDYLKRSADMDHLPNRLCCAQLLKMFFLRHEQKFLHESLRSRCVRDPADLFRMGLSKSPDKTKLPDVDSGLGGADDNSDNIDNANDDENGSDSLGDHSDDDDNNEEENDSAHGSDDSSSCHEGHKSSRSTGRRRMSVFPQDIEIY